VRGRAGIEELKGGREQIVITEIPYNVNRATLVERIADLVNEKILTDISASRDESDENTRVVVELKRDANPKVVINNLYKHTALESSFAVNDAGHRPRPPEAALPQGGHRLLHRAPARGRPPPHPLPPPPGRGPRGGARGLPHRPVQPRRLHPHHPRFTQSRGGEGSSCSPSSGAASRSRNSGSSSAARSNWSTAATRCHERQADSILELRLYQLTGLERDKIKGEYDSLIETIKDLLDILAKEARVKSIIKRRAARPSRRSTPRRAAPTSSRTRARSTSKT
jgi:DNA gyrase subunit A